MTTPRIALPQQSFSTATPDASLPGTPMSGVSTVAIKDGHEGHRQHHNEAAQERTGRLAVLGAAAEVGATDGPADGAGDYFPVEEAGKAVGKWRQEVGDADEAGDGESTNSGREARERARLTGGVAREGVVDTTVDTPEKL